MSTGIVMEGGAMRGMFTAGVLDVMMENEIGFDGGVGVSAGAVFGYNLKSKQIGRAIRYNKRFSRDWRYGSFASLILTGDFYGAQFCYEKVPFHYDPFDLETYRKNPMPFYAVVMDVETGKPVYRELKEGSGLDMLYLRASASMPVVSRPVEIMGHRYLDGGMVDPIPLRFMQAKGYEKNVVILTQAPGFRKEPAKEIRLVRVLLHKYPAAVKAMAVRHFVYNKELDHVIQCAADGNVLIIQPPEPLGIHRTERDPKELQRVYDIGRKTMEGMLQEVKDFIG